MKAITAEKFFHQMVFPEADWTDDSDQMILILQSLMENDGQVLFLNNCFVILLVIKSKMNLLKLLLVKKHNFASGNYTISRTYSLPYFWVKKFVLQNSRPGSVIYKK